MSFLRRVLLAAAVAGGCTTGRLGTGSETLGGAAATSAAAVGAAALARAAGDCIAICTAGTACNRNTGLCEPMPCRGECGPNEHCEQTFSGEKCVAGGPTSVETFVKGSTPIVPASVLPATAPPTDGSPTIVPAAEQAPPH